MSQTPLSIYKDNRFFFVIAAAKRAHALQENLVAPLVITQDDEKPTLTALREFQHGLLKEDGSAPIHPIPTQG